MRVRLAILLPLLSAPASASECVDLKLGGGLKLGISSDDPPVCLDVPILPSVGDVTLSLRAATDCELSVRVEVVVEDGRFYEFRREGNTAINITLEPPRTIFSSEPSWAVY